MRTLLYFLLCMVANTAYAGGWQFTRALQFGARGPDVFALQKVLNEDARTKVAERGAGSPGNETSYFGPATARAVAAFQRQNGIEEETGRMGEKTRAALNKKLVRTATTKDTKVRTDTKQNLPTPNLQTSKPPNSPPPHPNERNLTQFLDTVQRIGMEQGYTAENLEARAHAMRSYAISTTTDFFAQFVAENRAPKQAISASSPLRERLSAIFKAIAGAMVSRASAQIPSFGGMVLYVFPCTCSGNWLVGMLPLSVPPIVLITHYPGTQAFSNFNAPFTLFMLGNYIPQGAPCLFYAALACVPLPSQAQTTPMLGSS